MRNNVTAFGSLFFFVFLLAGCGQKLGDEEIYLGGEVIEKGDKIIVEGKSNLLPGSRLTGELLVDDGEKVLADSSEVVDDKGNFHMEMDHHKYGDAEVVVTFAFKGVQDEEIKENYGERGEKLKGPYVYVDEHWGDIEKKAVVRVPLSEDNESKKHEITEPEWNERPDDYGDPRVWMEVDKITTDKEFFYLKGKSNLLEGSLIEGEYSDTWKDDKTRIKPDGTFELKIEYKYSEDPYFTLKFNPGSGSQWKTIKETYGENGEKLVGKYVETSSNSQHIEVKVDYEPDEEEK